MRVDSVARARVGGSIGTVTVGKIVGVIVCGLVEGFVLRINGLGTVILLINGSSAMA